MRGVASEFRELDGLGRIHVRTAGAGDTGVVFVHGWPSCARLWDRWMAAAPIGRFRMAAPDLLGFGRSTAPPHASPSLTNQARVILETAARLRAETRRPVVAVGTSFGGRVLLEALLAKPKLFSRALLLAPLLAPAQGAKHSAVLRVVARHPRLERFSRTRLGFRVFGPFFAAQMWRDLPSVWTHPLDALAVYRDVRRNEHETAEGVRASPDVRASLPTLRVPVEVWYGDRDPILDPVWYQTALWPRSARTRWIPGGGHALTWTHVDEGVAWLARP